MVPGGTSPLKVTYLINTGRQRDMFSPILSSTNIIRLTTGPKPSRMQQQLGIEQREVFPLCLRKPSKPYGSALAVLYEQVNMHSSSPNQGH